MSGIVETQILRTLDKHDKIGTNGVVELLQKGPEDFGAGLDPVRAALIGEFLNTKGKDNAEALENMRAWFAKAPLVANRLKLIVELEKIEIRPGYTMFDELIDMPTNEDETWSDGKRPHNIAWALDDIVFALIKHPMTEDLRASKS